MVGEHMRSFPIETKSKSYQAVHIRVHPNFNHSTFESDIALVKLEKSVPNKWYSRPACLPRKSELSKFRVRKTSTPFKIVCFEINKVLVFADTDYVGQLAIVSGWGKTSEKGGSSDLLKEILVFQI